MNLIEYINSKWLPTAKINALLDAWGINEDLVLDTGCSKEFSEGADSTIETEARVKEILAEIEKDRERDPDRISRFCRFVLPLIPYIVAKLYPHLSLADFLKVCPFFPDTSEETMKSWHERLEVTNKTVWEWVKDFGI